MSKGPEKSLVKKPVYTLQGVSRRREKGGVVFELEIPELFISRGEFIAVVGPSGCGKSTLLDLLGLALSPSHAEEFTLSFTTGDFPQHWDVLKLKEQKKAQLRKKHLGYVLQNGGLLPFLTVRENIELPGRLAGTRDYGRHCGELADALGIADQLSKKPQNLSGGQRQRVAIARGLIHRPDILLADEPTAAVDRLNALEIREQFRLLVQEHGVTVLMVTHDHELVMPASDRLLTFELGKRGESHTVSRLKEIESHGTD